MAWQPEMEQSLRKHEVVQFKAENSKMEIKITGEDGLLTPNEIETPQPNTIQQLNESALHNQVIIEEEENFKADGITPFSGSVCSEDYGVDVRDED